MAGSNVALWSTTAGNNATVGSINWAEGQAPSTVNDSARLMMANVRATLNDLAGGWIEYGDGSESYTPTYVGATQFRIDGVDVTAIYHVGRRIRLVAATPGTIYGTITVSSFATNTTLTIAWDSGSLSNEAITSVMVSPSTATNNNQSQLSTLTLYSSDAGASEAPTLDLYRDSASPAASDVIGGIQFNGEDSAGNKQIYGRIKGVVVDPTSTSEDGRIVFSTVVAGSEADLVTMEGGAAKTGLYVGGKPATLVLLQTLTASASATLEFNTGDDNRYASYKLVLEQIVPATDTTILRMRLDSDTGASFDSGASYAWCHSTLSCATSPSAGNTGDDTDTEIELTVGVDDGGQGPGVSGVIWIIRGALHTRVTWLFHMVDNSGVQQRVHGSAFWNGDADAAQLAMSSGNIASGTIRCYGIPKA